MQREGESAPAADRTVLDSEQACPRLKEGLVPPETGLFMRIQEGEGAGRTFTFRSGGVFTLGREGADIALGDPKVSRKHAEMGLYGPDRYFIRDLASTNGTWVNGRRVRDRMALRHEDRVRIGDTVLQFAVVSDSLPVSDDR